jgi:membrane protein implicated in regulation of membrane protease activity
MIYEDKSQRRPVIDPLLLALKSRRVLIALSALIVGLLVMALPELQPVQDQILVLVIALALAVIGGYSVEDAARAGRERAALPPEDLKERIKEVLDSIVDETDL